MGLIEKYTPPTAADEYAEDIAELLSAGIGAAWELGVDVSALDADKAALKVASEKTKFQTAARNAGYSARERERDESVAGTVSLIFTLGDRVTRKRGEETPPVAGEPVAAPADAAEVPATPAPIA